MGKEKVDQTPLYLVGNQSLDSLRGSHGKSVVKTRILNV